MRLLVVVPFHDPKWMDNTVSNLRRQKVAVDALFVMNGEASGLRAPDAFNVSVQATSHAGAVNAGAAWGLTNGYTHAVCFDSDDYYGAGYVKQALSAFKIADYIGKRSVFVMLSEGLHLFARTEGRFLGGTVGFTLKTFAPMPSVLQDDTEWCMCMEERGLRSFDTGPSEFCYRRHGANSHWRANDMVVRRAWGVSRFFGKVPVDTVEKKHSANAGRLRKPPTDAEVLASL